MVPKVPPPSSSFTSAAATSFKTQKVDSKPSQGAHAADQSRVSNAIQVISLSFHLANIRFLLR